MSDEQPTPRRRVVDVPRVRAAQVWKHADDPLTWRVVRVAAGLVTLTRADGFEGEAAVWAFAEPSWKLVGDIEGCT